MRRMCCFGDMRCVSRDRCGHLETHIAPRYFSHATAVRASLHCTAQSPGSLAHSLLTSRHPCLRNLSLERAPKNYRPLFLLETSAVGLPEITGKP